jgi:transglutaminase-like putative cysteine protease
MKLRLTHTLAFSLSGSGRAVQHLLLTALATPQQKIERWSIAMPGFTDAATFRDGYGNRAHLVSQTKRSEPITVTVSGLVETTDKAGVLGRLEYDPPPALFRRATDLTKPDPELIEDIDPEGGRIGQLHEIMGRVHEKLSPSQSQSDGEQTQTFGNSDPSAFAHTFIAGARALDIPTRYVTGYLFDDGAAAIHAWAEAWDEGLGWIGFDPRLNVCPTDQHIRLASGLDAVSTMPVRSVPVWGEMPVETVEIVAE